MEHPSIPDTGAQHAAPPSLTLDALRQRRAQQEQIVNQMGNTIAGMQIYQNWIVERGKLAALDELIMSLDPPPSE